MDRRIRALRGPREQLLQLRARAGAGEVLGRAAGAGPSSASSGCQRVARSTASSAAQLCGRSAPSHQPSRARRRRRRPSRTHTSPSPSTPLEHRLGVGEARQPVHRPSAGRVGRRLGDQQPAHPRDAPRRARAPDRRRAPPPRRPAPARRRTRARAAPCASRGAAGRPPPAARAPRACARPQRGRDLGRVVGVVVVDLRPARGRARAAGSAGRARKPASAVDRTRLRRRPPAAPPPARPSH